MRLLPAGKAFLQHARRILAEVDAAVHSVRTLATTGPAAPGGRC
jgi:DNA-binding transcriptional LysR family regulator